MSSSLLVAEIIPGEWGVSQYLLHQGSVLA